MEIILALVVVVIAYAIWHYNRNAKGFDVNNDGKVDVADVKQAVQNVETGVQADVAKAADVNHDGKVDTADAKVAVETAVAKTKETVKKAAVKAKSTRSKKSKN